ncbi:hypothetical protein NL676_030278 [Syzygium grande]|nr:hypothetical protein NL676_030278 [Syzygium grande]
MPPISRPPPARRRSAAAAAASSALFLFLLLLPTPLPCATARPASAPPSDESSSSTPAFDDNFNPSLIPRGLHLRSLVLPPHTPRGLDPAIIESFPTVVYSAVKGHKIGEASLECAVCLNDFEDEDALRLIPKCDHAFHPDCIGAWLDSHTTCPVCRAELASQPAGDSESQQAESGTEPPRVEVMVEVAPPDAGALERSQRGREREGIQPPYLWDKNECGSFNNRNRALGSSRMQTFSRSHSTGHSLIRPGEDNDRFMLRLPAEVRKQLMVRPRPDRPQEGSSRRGYRCGGEGSSRGIRYFRSPDRLDRAAKSERWAFNRMPAFFARASSVLSPRVAADGGDGGSSRGLVQQARPAI